MTARRDVFTLDDVLALGALYRVRGEVERAISATRGGRRLAAAESAAATVALLGEVAAHLPEVDDAQGRLFPVAVAS